MNGFHVESIGIEAAKQLRLLAECEQEHAAITRLVEHRGTHADLILAASMFERVGEGENARALLHSVRETVE